MKDVGEGGGQSGRMIASEHVNDVVEGPRFTLTT
jgi:hypothetical protein